MDEQGESEAITVVIEKLTEIVEGGQTAHAEANNVESEQTTEELCLNETPVDIVNKGSEPEAVKQQSLVIVQGENDNYTKEDDLQQDPGKENEVHINQDIVLNLPPGLHNLNSTTPQALLQRLIQMTSGQVVVNQMPVVEDGADNAPLVENIGAEMVIPANNLYVGSTVTVYGKPGSQRIIQLLPPEGQEQANMPTVFHVPAKKKLIGTKIIKNASVNSDAAVAKNVLLKCAKCDYCSHNKHYLKQHVDLVHNADRPFKCPFCDYAGKRSHSLKEHLVVHSTNRPFECLICNASFRKKGHLTNHIRLHNAFKYFECSICQEKFKDRAQLYSHLRTAHEPNQVYECKLCEYATTIKSNIVMHMHTHGNPEIYRCNICSFTALHINILRQHMQTHSASNANLYNVETQSLKACPVILLKCSACGYTTDSKEALQNHMWQHLPEDASKEFSCSATRDADSEGGSTEEKDKEPTSIYKCTDCSYLCKEAYLFITHMLAHHPRQKLIADQQKQQQQELLQQKQQESTKDSESKESTMAFTHDSAAGMYRCTICGYMCEQQRTIKAHIWKHSGHKDIDYPMFQNGPISVYDDTPVGKAVLLSEKSKKPPIKVIPKPKEDEQNAELGIAEEAENQIVNGSLLVSSLARCEESEKMAQPIGAVTGMPNNAQLRQMPNQTTLAGSKSCHPVLSNQPIRWSVQQVNSATQVLPVSVPVQVASPMTSCVRFIAPLNTPTNAQVTVSTSVSPANCSPEIVRLILGAVQQQKANQCDLNSGLTINPCKRDISIEHAEDKDAMVGVAKRLCLEEIEENKSSCNVVVQQVSQIYTTPTLTIGTTPGSNHQPSMIETTESATSLLPMVTTPDSSSIDGGINGGLDSYPEIELVHEGTTGTESMSVESGEDSLSAEMTDIGDDKDDSLIITEVVVEMGTDEICSSEVEEVSVDDAKDDSSTLVKLLEMAHDNNHVCPSSTNDADENGELNPNTASTDTDPSDADSENAACEESKNKKGICSSLLAVIAQLRERSKSESEGDGKNDGGSEKKLLQKMKKTGGKRKSRGAALEDDTPIEQYQNVEKMNTNPAQYRCMLCHYSSNTTNGIKNHMRLHKTKQPFECSLCDYQADSSESLQEHMLQHCKVRTYHCKLCTAVFNYKSQLRAHMRAHNEKEPFLCDLCDYETANPIAFRNHSRVHTEKKDHSAVSEIGASEKSASMDSGRETQKDLACDECDYEAENSPDLILHIRNQHPVSYKCDQCEQQCATWSAFSAHMKMHLEVRTLKCELCDFVATSMRSLKSHMKRHVNDQRFVQQPLEQYKCNLCGYVCHHLPSLKSHMWRHASDKNYSYQITNDVINAAIDYDTNPAMSKSAVMATDVALNTSQTEASRKATTDILQSHDITPLVSTSSTTTSVVQSVKSPNMTTTEQSSMAPVRTVTRPCLVTFRCCQCGFESLDKSVLNDHMKSHLDIIRKTLEVNKTRLVARAMNEIGRIGQTS